jgi:hypothetical protein
MVRPSFRTLSSSLLPVIGLALGCGGSGASTPAAPTAPVAATPPSTPQATPAPSPVVATIRDDAGLFQLIAKDDPFGSYRLLPSAEEFASGRLDGSDAHRPVVRVSLNAIAFAALQNGKLPAGGKFPNGSVVFKQVLDRAGAPPSLYAVMRKDDGGPVSGAGWQWAEYRPDGSVAYSIASRGGVCTSCHMRQQGPQNDLVRSFERQP